MRAALTIIAVVLAISGAILGLIERLSPKESYLVLEHSPKNTKWIACRIGNLKWSSQKIRRPGVAEKLGSKNI